MRLVNGFCAAVAAAILAVTTHVPHVFLDPNIIGKAPITTWTTFNGDYRGQRYSTLNQIRPANVNRLEQRWVFKITGIGALRGTVLRYDDPFAPAADPADWNAGS